MRYVLALLLTLTLLLLPHAAAAQAVPIRLMAVGDSITRGHLAGVPFDQTDGYRGPLVTRLRQRGYSVDMVGSLRSGTVDPEHEGHDGWTIDQMRQSMPIWIGTQRPQVILLLAGTNDMKFDDWAQAPNRMALLLDLIARTDPAIETIVSKIPPISVPGYQPRVDQYNAALPGVTAGRLHVHLIDPGNLPLADGVHLTPDGYSLLADAWLPALVPILDRPTVTPSACTQRVVVQVVPLDAGILRVNIWDYRGAIQAVTITPNPSIQPVTDLAVAGATATFTLHRVADAGPYQAAFAVVDACGTWRTWAGRGS